ncbi:MAG: radical SAM protein [Elusimicrobiales bacterium]|nr:radical SAM protein [Elusimicrobiales bacterium]
MTYPKRVILETDYSCNLKCLTCKLWNNNYRKLRGEEERMELETAVYLCERLRKDNVTRITFIGGEPFLYKDFLKLVFKVNDMGFLTSVVTNGTLLTENLIFEIIKNNLFDKIIFSIDGYADIHDRIRGEKGVYGRVENNIKFLNHLKRKYNKKKPELLIYLTVSSYNIDKLDLSVSKIISLNPSKIRLQLASFVNNSLIEQTNNFLGGEFISMHSYFSEIKDKIDLEKLKNIFLNLKKIHGGRIVGEKILEDLNTNCSFLFKNAIITPSGKILPCPMLNNFSIGNLKERSLREVFLENIDVISKIKNFCEDGKLPICRQCCVEKVII